MPAWRISELKTAFASMARAAHLDGLPTGGNQRWRTAEDEQHRSEAALWAVINSCAKAIARTSNAEDAAVAPGWTGVLDFNSFLDRLTQNAIVGQCLSYVQAPMSIIISLSTMVDLEGANLEGAYFYNGSLHESTFAGAKLTNATFGNCFISSVSFEGAELNKTSFRDCSVSNVNLSSANSEDIRVSSRTLMISELDAWEPVTPKLTLDDRYDHFDYLAEGHLERVRGIVAAAKAD